MIAFVFPGQGSQRVGMGRALADSDAKAAEVFTRADRAFAGAADPDREDTGPAGVRRLTDIIFEGPEDDLTLTEHAQPALLTVSIAAFRVLSGAGITPAFVAGHSLGEYSANVAAGTIAFDDAVATVRRRGRYMQEAVPRGTGAMAAILGLDGRLVEQACEESAGEEVVSPANLNAPGQVVIAGSTAAVSRASERAKALGAKRVMALAVSAPFHCALMKPAERRLEPELRALQVRRPEVPIVANVDAEVKRDAPAAIDALVQQVSCPVRWEAVVRRLALEGATTYVEVGPGTVLSGLVRKIHPEARVAHFGSPEDLETVVKACSI